MATSKYPSLEEVKSIFANWESGGDPEKFFARVSDEVEWLVMGHSEMSKLYVGKTFFRASTFSILNPILTKPITMSVRNVVGGGDQAWAVAEMTADSVCKNGMVYDQVYAFNEEGQIVEVRAYVDTQLVTEVMEANK
ncbi:hypothetical protein AJ80_01976 [Polytolypa hystricis UAMH7299]|uniref:SnoaL-like domain-containing protein n=1 Tax=Polytolypa hystricis (strain UAMH7299) TaxID=1447883 RepID=A0A2B7YIK4_POLH7|nr:hypothetical protein AJ80_01976 [Polytolypa hystricis UAMH7299]